MLYLATKLDDNSAILIDEPENSLHPQWQKDYIRTLLDLFRYYQPKIVAATHSVLIVTGAEVSTPQTKVVECRNFIFQQRQSEPVNIEQAFVDYFRVLTPENRYLSEHLINILNKLAEKQLTIDSVLVEINRLKNESFESKQQDVLNAMVDIAQRIANEPKN